MKVAAVLLWCYVVEKGTSTTIPNHFNIYASSCVALVLCHGEGNQNLLDALISINIQILSVYYSFLQTSCI